MCLIFIYKWGESSFFTNVPVFRIRDPVIFWLRDPGWVKNPRSGSGMNIPDHISESPHLQRQIWLSFYLSPFAFGLKILKFLMRTWNLFDTVFEMEKFGSRINIPDPQQWNIRVIIKWERYLFCCPPPELLAHIFFCLSYILYRYCNSLYLLIFS
jgi:hypothetical protein